MSTFAQEAVNRPYGFTYNPVSGLFLEIGQPGYVVSLAGTEVRVPVGLVDEALLDWYLTKLPEGKLAGGWQHEGNFYLDQSVIVFQKDKAIELAQANNQLAYFDLQTGRSIYFA